MAGHFDENGQWVSGEWTEAGSQYRPAQDRRPITELEYKCVEVSPGILYVVLLPIGMYDRYITHNPGAKLPMQSHLVATFSVAFADATSSRVDIPFDETMEANNYFFKKFELPEHQPPASPDSGDQSRNGYDGTYCD